GSASSPRSASLRSSYSPWLAGSVAALASVISLEPGTTRQDDTGIGSCPSAATVSGRRRATCACDELGREDDLLRAVTVAVARLQLEEEQLGCGNARRRDVSTYHSDRRLVHLCNRQVVAADEGHVAPDLHLRCVNRKQRALHEHVPARNDRCGPWARGKDL